MIGDSLTSDIAGAHAAGLDAIWVNRFGQPGPCPDGVREISTLADL
jgi:2-haloacid dehalogenase/putative hydrolase of the HAD superfamily